MQINTAREMDWKKRFFIIWVGQAFSIIGSMLVQFALVWYLTAQTGSAAVLATSTLMALLPRVLLGPFAGALVDRWNRKLVMIVADGSIAVFTLVLVVLFWTGNIQVWHIYVISFIRSLGGAFHFPAMSASTGLMVPDKHLARVNGINQALNGGLNIAAPPLGAILVGALPMHTVLSIDIFTALVAILPLLFVVIPQPERKLDGAVTPRKLLLDVREGLVYVSRFRGLMVVLAMASMINFLFNPAYSLMPLLVTRIFKGGALQLGFLESAMGIGVIAGGLALGVWGGFKRKIFTSMLGLIGMGAGTLLISFATGPTHFWMAVVGMTMMGAMGPIVDGPLIAAAPAAEAVGIQFWYMLAGGGAILMAIAMVTIRPVLHMEEDLKADAQKGQAILVGVPVPSAASD